MTAGRVTVLALKELYRPVTVREGDKVIKLPAIQAVLRSKVALAAKGNGPAQRALIEIARVIEKDLAAQKAANDDVPAKTPMTGLEAARLIAAALTKVARDNPTEFPLVTGSASDATR